MRLRCVVPVTPYKSTWSYTWYNGPEQLSQFGQDLILWNIKTKKSGKYYCQGSRHTSVQDIATIQSLPVEISVDGKMTLYHIISGLKKKKKKNVYFFV